MPATANHKPPYLYELIATLTSSERRAATDWLASPYHQQREDCRALFAYLAEAIDQGQQPSRAECWAAVFPKQPFEDQKMRLVMSYLNRSLEAFLQQQEMEGQAGQYEHLLLAAYRKRGLNRHFAKAQHQLQKRREKTALQSPEYFLQGFWLEREIYRQQSKAGRTKALNLQEQQDQLTRAFLGHQLRLGCHLLAHESVYKASYRIPMEAAWLALAQQAPYCDQPGIAVYLHCFLMLREPAEDQHFIAFREQLFAVTPYFPKGELRDLYLLAINFCIRRINQTAEQFLQEALALYRKGLETELLLEEGWLSRFTYNNVVGIALRLQAHDWVEQFLHEYRPLLKPEQRGAAFSLNAARLAFVRGRFRETLGHLQSADYRDFINNMVAKTLQLKVYYELGEYDLLESHLRNMRTFLRRKRKMSYHQQNYRNIVQLTQRLIALPPMDKAAQKRLRADLLATEPLTERHWLLEKLEAELS